MLVDDKGTIHIAKTPSTPKDLTVGFFRVMEKLGINMGNLDLFTHGTTVALNALLQRKVVRTGLITTKGYRDVLEIMRGNRPDMYNLQQDKPAPFVPRYLRLEIGERLNYRGEVIEPLDRESLATVLKRLNENHVESTAICLLHSYANPKHELLVKEAVRKANSAMFVCASSEIASEWREFERTSTTVINAAAMPIIARYLSSLEQQLSQKGFSRELMVMQSNGGLMTTATARQVPVRTLFSGPAAGAIGGAYLARMAGISNAITYDMGGTTCIVSLVQKSVVRTKPMGEIERWPIMVPMVDANAIGAGGGSIAWVDVGGGMRVGPESAGADPGPVCYATGGTEPTVTDAQVVLGRINPRYFIGGEIKLDVNGAKNAVKEKIAAYFGMDILEVANGIIEILVANQARLIRTISVERGYDPRDFTLIAFGGAGGLHAAMVAEELSIPRVVVSFAPGHMSCLGQIVADTRHDFVRTFVRPINEIESDEINEIYTAMEHESADRLATEGVPSQNYRVLRTADLRYLGQEYTVETPIPTGRLTGGDLIKAADAFNDLYYASYGYCTRDMPVEIVNLRITGIGMSNEPNFHKYPKGSASPAPALKGNRDVFFEENGSMVACRTYEWEKLKPGNIIEGPAMIEEPGSTITVFPRHEATVDEYLNIHLKMEE